VTARVAAVVVTRDRPALLVEGVRGLLGQTRPVAAIVVFDNASRPPAADALRDAGLLDEPRIVLARSEVNLGGAGGYGAALARALGLEPAVDWLWLMDDDAEPVPDALARLLDAPVAAQAGTVAVCTAVRDPEGRIDPLHRCRLRGVVVPLGAAAYAPGSDAVVDCASFVGLLVRASAARAAGLPLPEYFIGYDDAEWSLRLRAHGQIRLVPESVIVHKTAIGAGAPTRRSRLWNRLLGTHYTSSPWPSYWRDLYRVRNLIDLRRRHGGLGRVEFVGLVGIYVIKTLLFEERPLRRLPWLVRFALRGRRGDFSAPGPDAWARAAAAEPRRRGYRPVRP
jgi:rhamnopyranosyl-N-acetylglucosaminyl-diphospho-decaprenol beta-1,3/1,4-galactofuranosyltransferase